MHNYAKTENRVRVRSDFRSKYKRIIMWEKNENAEPLQKKEESTRKMDLHTLRIYPQMQITLYGIMYF